MALWCKNNKIPANATDKRVSRPKCEKVRLRRKPNDNNTNCFNNQKNNIKAKNSE